MALTRAQLLMGDGGQGAVLTGQVQGVKQGNGITILANGTIEVNSQTVVGVMKLGQTPAAALAAYNGYNWPTSTGSVDQQLTIDSIAGGVTTLAWKDPDMIPWTTKGQLVVGTGANTQTLLNAGPNGSILIADSSTASGLNYTSDFVTTSGSTGAANIPAGAQGLRPVTPPTGAIRYNSTTTSLEFYNGTGWETVASSTTNGFVEQTSTTGAAIMPAGTQLQRPGGPAGGYLRFNDDTDAFEFWNGFSWQSIASSATGSFVDKTVPVTGTPSAAIPVGTQAQRQSAPAAGYFRFNDDRDKLEFFDGAVWQEVASGNTPTPPVPATIVSSVDVSGGTTGFSFTGGPITSSGTMTMSGTLAIANGGTGATTATVAINNLLPSQGGNAGKVLSTDGTNPSWIAGGGGGSGTVTSVDVAGGTTGLTFSGGPVTTSGTLTMAGTLGIGNGGTGQTNATAAINALLPSQGGNANKALITNGTNVSWGDAGFLTGTRMPFAQAAAPVGWTQDTSAAVNDSAIRLVTGAGGGTGGALNFSTVFVASYPISGTVTFTGGSVGATTLSIAQLASHNHNGTAGTFGVVNPFNSECGGAVFAGNNVSCPTIGLPGSFNTGGDASHTHSLAGASSPATLNGAFNVKYVDMIICTKN